MYIFVYVLDCICRLTGHIQSLNVNSMSKVIEINAGSLPTPKTIEELQNNYILFEDMGLDIQFK